MTQKSESRTNGPHVAAKEGPRDLEERGRWSDGDQVREPARELEDEGANPIVRIVQHHPLSAVMTGFGFGLGFGWG